VTALLALSRTARSGSRAPYPRQLWLDWTDYCNARCFFCNGGSGGFIPFASLRNLEDVFSKVKVFGISSAIGEPLLHPELEAILTWLYQINPSIQLQVVTNGTTLTSGKAGLFAGHLNWLSVSLNASNGEAHMRDMFPHLAERGIDPEKRWNRHLRHLTEFVAALPAEDRARIRFQMVAHRYNVNDVVDFVRLVHRMGACQAVIANIAVHPHTLDWSLFWIKDQFNDVIEEACEVGARLGVRIHSAKFYTGVKARLDLDQVCRDPVDVAFISRSSLASPCCNWTENQIPVDYYNDEKGFENYWNSDLLQKLRKKRNLPSCRICGLARLFDETSFHFSPSLKKQLIAEGRLSEINSENDYPDADLVRICVSNRLDLPSVRRTLLRLNLPVELVEKIQSQGLGALPGIEQRCWEAFRCADVPVTGGSIALGGPILGIGWGTAIHDPVNRFSARWISAAQAASIFIRAPSESGCQISFTVHQERPREIVSKFSVEACGRLLPTTLARDRIGRTVLRAVVPDEIVRAFGGRLWVKVGHMNGTAKPEGEVSLMHLSIGEPNGEDLAASEVPRSENEKDLTIAQQRRRLAEVERELQAVYASRSWRITSPLRKAHGWFRRFV
jgi:MoaA/NifB/PqqE/SkfB family radical SAM enzyme